MESAATSIEQQASDDSEVQAAKLVPGDVVQEVRVRPEALLELRIWQELELVKEFAVEAGRRGSPGATCAPRPPRISATPPPRRDAGPSASWICPTLPAGVNLLI